MKHNSTLRQLSPTTFCSDDDDPWFKFDGPFERGTYRLEFHAQALEEVPPSNMKLYVARPDGVFLEDDAVPLGRMPRQGEKDKVKLLLRLNDDIPQLRFDPQQTPGSFHFSNVRIERVDEVAEKRDRKSWRGRYKAVRAWVRNLIDPPEFVPVKEIDVDRQTAAHDHADFRCLPQESQPAPKAEALRSQPQVQVFSLPNVVPLNFAPCPGLEPKLNVLIPGMSMRHMSGGPNTAINLTYRMAQAGVPLRYISTDSTADKDHGPLWDHFSSLTGINERLSNVEIVCAYDRNTPTPIGENDVFFGTAWWTVQMIKHTLPQMRSRRFMYIIQDFEPALYAWSTPHVLALETYSLDFRGIICGELLAEYLCVNRIGRFADPKFIETCAPFEPAVDTSKFYAELYGRRSGKKRLLFYARPNAPRNLYELGSVSLHQAVERGAFPADEWELLYMGEKLPPLDLGRGVSIQSYPWSNYEDYAKLLRSSDVGLSLMLSPHTSYPPLEMAACGTTVVTNTYSIKTAERLKKISGNILAVAPNLEAIVEGLMLASRRATDLRSRQENAKLTVPTHWNHVFNPLIPKLLDMWEDCLTAR